MNAFRLIVSAAVLLLVAAAGLILTPLRATAPATTPMTEIGSAATTDLSRFAELFDLSRLPPLRAPAPVSRPAAPPPDPAAGLRRYRLIGLAVSDARAAGVFERDGATLVLAAGESLESFVLQRVDSAGAAFVRGDLEINLVLEQAPGE